MKKGKGIAKQVDNVLVPKIYQVRFEKVEPIQLKTYPALNQLGDWLSHSTAIWGCHSELEKKDFEDQFYAITKLSRDDVKIFYGGDGTSIFSPGWRQSVNHNEE